MSNTVENCLWHEVPRNVRNLSLHPDMLGKGFYKDYKVGGITYHAKFEHTFVMTKIVDLVKQLGIDEKEVIKLIKKAYPMIEERKRLETEMMLKQSGLTRDDLLAYLD